MQHQSRQSHHRERCRSRSQDCSNQASSPKRKCLQFPNIDIVDASPSKQQQSRTFRARKQIIVSGGTLSSPLILQRSGIGDSKKLQRAGVKPLVNLPGVGQNFQDHYLTFSVYRAKPGKHSPC
jgi:choline dehydrogenase-like flavoprotein